jgi:Fanconi-associated nuclease 1
MQGSVLAGILKLIASDPFYWSGGQPDLLVWNSRTKRVMFAEVKGPGDHLSPRQRWWLAHLMSVGAEAEVCYVVEERTTYERKNGKRRKATEPKVKTPTQSIKDEIELIELD